MFASSSSFQLAAERFAREAPNILPDKPSSQKRLYDEQPPLSKLPRESASKPTKRKKTIGLTEDPDNDDSAPLKKAKKKQSRSSGQGTEKRAKRFRDHPPKSYLEKLVRATTQKMFVLRRTRGGTPDAPQESVDMVGTTGNIYTVTISTVPWCSCPDSLKGNQCKHIVYVLLNVLKARGELRYQLAFLSTELKEMFENAPIITVDSDDTDEAGKRKPIDGDCPICFMELDAQNEEIIWCRTSCGNNVHITCFRQWAAATQKTKVQCVYCRAEWEMDSKDFDAESLLKSDRVGEDGYINVASEVGLSGERDYSTYNQFWVNRHLGRGRYRGYRGRYPY